MVMNKKHQLINPTSREISEPSKHKSSKKGQQKNIEFRINSPTIFNIEVRENLPTNPIPEIQLNKLPSIPSSHNLHHSESDVTKFSSSINKNFLFTIENRSKDIQDLSNSFTNEEIRSKARKKMTEIPKKLGLLDHARKNTYVKTPVSMKHLPKLKKSPDYGNNFMELIINTYCKKKEQAAYKKGEFGLGTLVTNEEFYSIIHSLEECSGSRTSRTVTKSALDYYSNSRSSSPVPEEKNMLGKAENEFKVNGLIGKNKGNGKIIRRKASAIQIASQNIINPKSQVMRDKRK